MAAEALPPKAGENSDETDWRARLAEAVYARGFRLTKLSTDLGFHRDYVSNVLSGKARPSAARLARICAAVGFGADADAPGAKAGSEMGPEIGPALPALGERSLEQLQQLIRFGRFDRFEG